VTTLYFSGLKNDSASQILRYMDKSGFPGALGLLINPVPIEPYDAHDLRRFNVAQEGDLKHAMEQVTHQMKLRPHDRFILFGTSRGAALALQVANALSEDDIKRVAFTVCEGVFDTAPAVMESRFGALVTKTLTWFLPKVTEYNPYHVQTPLWIAEHFKQPHHPVLMVTSQQDTVVPMEHTQRVFDAMHPTATCRRLLVLIKSPHSSYATWDHTDRCLYKQVMQEWVNKYV